MVRSSIPALAGVLVVALAALLPASASAAEGCAGDPGEIHPITLTVEGEPATGLYTLPAGAPRGLVVFAHGAANTSDTWRRHLPDVAAREGVIAVAMDYRGMQVTGVHPERGTQTARGWPATDGAEDLIAAAQHFDGRCPGLAGIIMYGVSMGGNMSGLAVAEQARRADGRPLFDYWIAIEGVHNLIESYQEARAAALAVPFARTTQEDIEAETGGPFEAVPGEYARRTNLNRTGDLAASGLRGVVLVHAYEDGTVPYNQSAEMTRALRDAGVPTDLYSVGGRGSDESDTTIGGYAGVQTGNAGHGWEGSKTHVVIQTGFDRLNALITRGEPAPCDRDFVVDEQPSNVNPDPRQGSPDCRPDPLPPAGRAADTCRDTRRPARPALKVKVRKRRAIVKGRASDRGCGRVTRVAVSLGRKVGNGRCRFINRRGRFGSRRACNRPRNLRARGSESWRLVVRRRLPRGRYVARARARDDSGNRGRLGRVRFRVRR